MKYNKYNDKNTKSSIEFVIVPTNKKTQLFHEFKIKVRDE